jgi:phage/plasmid-associated DNA primase
MLDKVDAAIARRLLTFHFGSLFKSKEFLEKNDIVDGQGSIFVGDESIKFKPFLTKYRVPFLNLLLPYFQKFKRAGYTITGVPESIEKESQKYMEESDQLYSWFNANYEKTDNKTDVIKLKDVFAGLKESEYYFNLTKAEKRKLTYNSLIEYVERSPLLRMYYKEWTRVDKSAYRNALMGFAIRSNISETPPSEI